MEQIPPTPTNPNEDKDKLIAQLINTVEEVRKEFHELKTQKIVDELQLSEEVLKESGVLPKPPHRLKQGKSWRPLLESEILEAQSKFVHASDCARYLGLAYPTYKRYCVRYNLHKPHPWGPGSKKRYWDPNKGKYPLNRILNNECPNYEPYRLKDLLIRSGTKKPECEQCGYCERRLTDNKIALILNFDDGNSKNHKLENLRILCYNCTFTCGRGYIRNGKVDFHFNDPDRMQGAKRKIENRF